MFIIYANYSDVAYYQPDDKYIILIENSYVDFNGEKSYIEKQLLKNDNCTYFKSEATFAKWVKCNNGLLVYFPPAEWSEDYYSYQNWLGGYDNSTTDNSTNNSTENPSDNPTEISFFNT